MCFTININTTRDAIEKHFHADTSSLRVFEFRYFYKAFENPLVPVITQDDPEKVQLMQWGLIPHWARDLAHAESIRKGTYNARSETLKEKPSFQESYNKKRCIIITSGFFEWQLKGKQKIPWYIHNKDLSLMAMAGIYDYWSIPADDRIISSFSIITVNANPLMRKIHNTKYRMPALLFSLSGNLWIDPGLTDAKANEIMTPCDDELLNAYTISKKLSKTDTDSLNPSILHPHDYYVDGTIFN